MKVTIEFETDNAAFDDGSWAREVRSSSMQAIGALMADGKLTDSKLFDANGNKIGFVRVTE